VDIEIRPKVAVDVAASSSLPSGGDPLMWAAVGVGVLFVVWLVSRRGCKKG
jgi:hypothetical protein